MTISIEKMRAHLVKEDRLFSVEKRSVLSLPDDIAQGVNCYGFAIGCLCPGKEGDDYIPGFTGNTPYQSKTDLLEKICLDLENLGINFRKISFFGPRNLKQNEYLIKVFYSDPNSDFHLVRQNRKTNLWYHKPGFQSQPVLAEIIGFAGNYEPNDLAFLDSKTLKMSYYYPVGYFAIEEA